MAIYESRHTYDSSRPLEPWLFATVGATHFKRYASRAGWLEFIEKLPEKAPRDSGNLRTMLQGAIAKLPEIQREALVLMKVDGLSLEEASERIGSSVGALKLRVHRAYEALKKSLLGYV